MRARASLFERSGVNRRGFPDAHERFRNHAPASQVMVLLEHEVEGRSPERRE